MLHGVSSIHVVNGQQSPCIPDAVDVIGVEHLVDVGATIAAVLQDAKESTVVRAEKVDENVSSIFHLDIVCRHASKRDASPTEDGSMEDGRDHSVHHRMRLDKLLMVWA